MINLKSRKVVTASKAVVLVILVIAVSRLGIELSDAELQMVAGAVTALAMAIIGGIAHEDAAKHGNGNPPGPMEGYQPRPNSSDPVRDSPPPRRP